jgi:hypothetical protein
MFAALLVSLCVSQLDPSGQGRAPIDVDYVAQAGDLCLLGRYSLKVEGRGERSPIDGAECFSSAEKAREWLEAVGDRSRVGKGPESYRPRALTPITVKKCREVAIRRDGEMERSDIILFEVMAGEFEGREFWTAAWHAIRFKAPGR